MRPTEARAREIAETLYDAGGKPLTGDDTRETFIGWGVGMIDTLAMYGCRWRPIKSAPTDDVLDVWVPAPDLLAGGCRVPDVYWSADEQAWCDEDGVPLAYPPSHWMRRPEKPEGT